MDEYLKLHQALSKAEVEYQKEFDAVKNFELGLLSRPIDDVLQTLDKWDNLQKEERNAFNKVKAARIAWKEYLKGSHKHHP